MTRLSVRAYFRLSISLCYISVHLTVYRLFHKILTQVTEYVFFFCFLLLFFFFVVVVFVTRLSVRAYFRPSISLCYTSVHLSVYRLFHKIITQVTEYVFLLLLLFL